MALVDIGRGPIEHRLEPAPDPTAATRAPLVFLHEGLGSVGLWRDVPDRVRAATGAPTTLVYSRHGHGRSVVVTEPAPVSYMHHEADVVLPALLHRLGIERPVLIGHSDGASIALLHAGAGHDVAGLVLLAPHVFVEDVTVASIEAVRDRFDTTDLAERMSRHHDDATATFRRWNDVWLSRAFRTWDITDRLGAIEAPVLVIQGLADEYGTLAQVDAIEAGVSGPCERLVLDGVGHAPHLEAPDATIAAITRFVTGLRPGGCTSPTSEA